MSRRVVITGIGPISPNGQGKKDFWDALVQGRSGIDRIKSFDPSDYSSQIGGEVKGFDPLEYLEPKEVRRMDRFSHFAVAATQMALEDAGLKITPAIENRVGVIIGSGIGGLGTLEEQHKVMLEKGPSRVSPFLIPMMICNMAAGNVAMVFRAKGPNTCVVTACASSSHAIGDAYEIIKRGGADVCIGGGAEAGLTPFGLAGFCALRALSTRNDEPQKASRPFDVSRDGFVMGEGAGILILEELEFAKSRGAHIYCELAGYGASADAYHQTAPDPKGKGAARAMQMALDEAGISPGSVDYINAHGTSTPLNDEFETLAIKNVFGEHAYKLKVSSTKSMTGHLLGAAGGLEAIVCALAIENSIIPPTINLENPDPLCDLDYVPHKAVTQDVSIAISNSLGFGGHNATLLVKKFSD